MFCFWFDIVEWSFVIGSIRFESIISFILTLLLLLVSRTYWIVSSIFEAFLGWLLNSMHLLGRYVSIIIYSIFLITSLLLLLVLLSLEYLTSSSLILACQTLLTYRIDAPGIDFYQKHRHLVLNLQSHSMFLYIPHWSLFCSFFQLFKWSSSNIPYNKASDSS